MIQINFNKALKERLIKQGDTNFVIIVRKRDILSGCANKALTVVKWESEKVIDAQYYIYNSAAYRGSYTKMNYRIGTDSIQSIVICSNPSDIAWMINKRYKAVEQRALDEMNSRVLFEYYLPDIAIWQYNNSRFGRTSWIAAIRKELTAPDFIMENENNTFGRMVKIYESKCGNYNLHIGGEIVVNIHNDVLDVSAFPEPDIRIWENDNAPYDYAGGPGGYVAILNDKAMDTDACFIKGCGFSKDVMNSSFVTLSGWTIPYNESNSYQNEHVYTCTKTIQS